MALLPTVSGTPGTPQIALTIAGHDPSNGAGITADLQVFAAFGLYGTSAITAMTVQNTLGVSETHPVDPKVLSATLRNLVADLPPAGIKIGMLATAEHVRVVAEFLRALREKKPSNRHIPVVLDTVIASSSGATLLDPVGIETMKRELIDLVTCITPNRQELGILTNQVIPGGNNAKIVNAALYSLQELHQKVAVITTNGEGLQSTDIVLMPGSKALAELTCRRIETTSDHGTGCAFSSAVLANLVLGRSVTESAIYAKRWVKQALRTAPQGIGKGHGPMNLTHRL